MRNQRVILQAMQDWYAEESTIAYSICEIMQREAWMEEIRRLCDRVEEISYGYLSNCVEIPDDVDELIQEYENRIEELENLLG